mmetsp:Transcript_10378/g.26611  ORF Transcript_10378/g.26611 Transcript_10378/m.26611 type:complete len:317 (+) Transcript_10378:1009-1959(+)
MHRGSGCRLPRRAVREERAVNVAVHGEAIQAGAAEVLEGGAAQGDRPRQHRLAQRDAVRREQVVQRGHVGAAGVGRPPAARVVVVEAHLLHHRPVVPLPKHEQPHAQLRHVRLQLVHLLAVVLLLAVHQHERAVALRVKAREGAAQHLHEVAGVGEEVVHVLEVGVRVVAVPVEDVGVHVQVVARDVARRVADAVELVPQDALLPRRRGDDVHFDGHRHLGGLRGGFPGVGRRLDGELHSAGRLPADAAPLGRHGEVQREEAGPGPQALAVRKVHLQVLAVAAVGDEHRAALKVALHAHAVEHRHVDYHRHCVRKQ